MKYLSTWLVLSGDFPGARHITLGPKIYVGLLVLLCAICSFLILLSLPRFIIVQEATVIFDMEVSRGQTAALFVNRFDQIPKRLPIAAGQRHTYLFAGVFADIKMMRLDPTDLEGSIVIIYGVTVADSEGVLRRISPGEIAKWSVEALKPTALTPDLVRFEATGNNPWLLTGTVIPLRHTMPDWLALLARGGTTNEFFVPFLEFSFLLLCSAAIIGRRRSADLPLTLAVVALVVSLVPWFAINADRLSSTSRSVGRAGFFGHGTHGNFVALMVALAGTAVLSGLSSWWFRRQPFVVSPKKGDQHAPVVLILSGVAVVCFLVSPDIFVVFNTIINRPFSPDWDGNNILVWAWLSFHGFQPLRDFWYPYGGMYLFDLPAPWCLVTRFIYKWWIYGGLFVVTYRISCRFISTLIFVTILFLGDRMGLFWGFWRYALGLLMVLSYIGITSRGEGRVLFWTSTLFTAVFEPLQLAYAAPAVAMKVGLDFCQVGASNLRMFAVRLLQDFCVPAILTIALFVLLMAIGEGQGLSDFLLGLGDASIYSAVPTNLVEAAWAPFSIGFIILAAPFVLLAIGLFDRIAIGRPERLADTMIVIGLFGFGLLQKHLVRPIDWQLLFIPYTGLAFYLMLSVGRRGVVEFVTLGLLMGAAVAAFIQIGAFAALGEIVLSGPSSIANGVLAFAAPNNRFALANERWYADDKFDMFVDEKAVIAEIARANGGRVPRIFVLGDSPVVYILADQAPPYHVNDYSATPVYEQRKILGFLDREKPPIVVWDPNTRSFDLFQSVVRNPLIYNAVIANYVPDRRVGRFELLRRRASNNPIALDFWRERLGSVVNYGHFARASTFPSLAPCPGDSSACQEFLVVTKKEPTMSGRVVVGIVVDGRRFEIWMETVAGERELHVSLDRLWFWGVMKNAGLIPKIYRDSSTPAIDLSIKLVAARPNVLY
jgi:hypothetical protein